MRTVEKPSARTRIWRITLVVAIIAVRLVFASKAAAQNATGSKSRAATAESPPPPKSLAITPRAITVMVGEPQRLRLTDEHGRIIRDATWTVSDPALAEVHADGEVRVTGLAPGRLTITAISGNLTAQANVRILGEAVSSQGGASGNRDPVEITPNTVGMVVGEPRWLRLSDESGRQIRDAEWSVSDPALAKIQPGADAVIVALAPGHLKVTAAWQGHSASSQVNIFPGPELPQGTIRWSIDPVPGFSTRQILQAQPVEGGPDLYAIEEDRCNRVLTRALTIDGREMWRTMLPGTVASMPPGTTLRSSGRPTTEISPRQESSANDGSIMDEQGCAEPTPRSKPEPPDASSKLDPCSAKDIQYGAGDTWLVIQNRESAKCKQVTPNKDDQRR